MPTPAILLVIATLLPLVAFGLLALGGKRMGTPLAGVVGTIFMGGSLVCSMAALVSWLNVGAGSKWGAGRGPVSWMLPWLPGGINGGYLDVGVYVDSFTVAMFLMITTVAVVVHVFSITYMRDDEKFARYFTYLGLFCFSMLGLVIGGTLLQIFVFWELVGLCSYLLIGFWSEKKTASNAAMKAMIVNRVGDVGFMIAMAVLVAQIGNVSLPRLWMALSDGQMIMSQTMLTLVGVGLFCGAAAKSGQFPLHVWLPDAMEGPTPISALIHAATMVAAGVYLVGRIFPILTPDAKLVVASIGCITLTMGALIAMAQTDIKRVLAYSTISQLGYMMLAMGVGSWVGGVFHLMTHAFFKALLFLGCGSVIYAAGHEREMKEYGGLLWRLPVTALTFAVGVLAVAGTPYLAGYYSKDLILTHAASFGLMSGKWAVWAFFYVPAGVSYLTAFYMARCWMLTFWGKPRNEKVYESARETPGMYMPLVMLAILSIISGKFMNVREMLEKSVTETELISQAPVFATAWPADLPKAEEEEPIILTESQKVMEQGGILTEKVMRWGWLVGLGLGFVVYVRGFGVMRVLRKVPPIRWVGGWLYRGMYVDELYVVLGVGFVRMMSKGMKAVDRYVIDAGVNGLAKGIRKLSALAGLNDEFVVDGMVGGVVNTTAGMGAVARWPMGGRVRVYVMVMIGGIAAILLGTVLTILAMR